LSSSIVVALHAYVGGDIAGLGLPDERMDQQAVDDLESALGDVLVGAVDRVAGLKRDDCFPALLGEGSPGLGRREAILA
jgi:hypothetical protein